MKKSIVTTTINPPTEALKKFGKIAKQDGWKLIIVGDKKTPEQAHRQSIKDSGLESVVTYLDPEDQDELCPELSKLLGWNCIQRRNIGLVYAYEQGAEIIATVDDDNIPMDGWGQNCKVGEVTEVFEYTEQQPAFDPLSPHVPNLWHRGYPLQFLDGRHLGKGGMVKRKVLVQADLWNGDPDVDAICRIAYKPDVVFQEALPPYCSDKISPFNSQNTFLHRSVFPTYFLFPGVGRMDDIWASYVTQFKFPDSVIYSKASVTQDRNEHDLVKDLKDELLGYEHNADFVQSPDSWEKFVPAESLKAYEAYKRCFDGS